MTVCSLKGCSKTAEYAPLICVPTKDIPIDVHIPSKILVNLPLCKKCIDRLTPPDVMDEEMKKAFIHLSRGSPDFDRAYVHKQPLTSDLYYDTFNKRVNHETLNLG